MNRPGIQPDDLITHWFKTSNIQPPDLTQKACFEFSPANLHVHSNNATFIREISNRFHYYLRESNKLNSDEREVIDVDVISLNDSEPEGEINLPPSWNGISIDLSTPKGLEVFRTDYFYHLKIDHREAVWRPHDLLVSFSLGKKRTIKFLISESSDPIPINQTEGALKRKGPVDWEEIADMVLMVFMRLFDSFCLHAASLIMKDKAVIMTGPSGSGKTTTALTLLRSGATLLSDELTLLPTQADQNPYIAGILVKPRLFHQDINNELLFNPVESQRDARKKKPVDLPADIIQKGIYEKGKPALILFLDLKQNNRPKHILHRMDRHEALTNLVAQVLDPYNSTRHKEIFETLFQLVDRSSLYRLELGRDVGELPGIINNLL